MPTRTLPALAGIFATSPDISHALAVVAEEAGEIDRSLLVHLLLYYARKGLICERIGRAGGKVSSDPIAVSLDHLPPPIRKRIAAGDSFADFGNQSADYMKLLGMAPQDGAVLSMRGLHMDGELAGVLAITEARKRFGSRLIERISPACDLFALAFARILEHEARTEAVSALEALTRTIHSEYEKTISDLEARIAAAYDAQRARDGESPRVGQLERALSAATADARTMTERLAAVEEQVEAAVGRLERAHIELHAQNEAVRAKEDLLFRIERILSDERSADDPRKIIDELRSIVSARG